MPFNEGQIINLEVNDLNHRGEGVGKANGFTHFIPGALPGENVTIKVMTAHKTYAEAAIVSINKISADRITPSCPYFEFCGGCQLQHLSYDKQLLWKQKLIFETLRRIAGIRTPVEATLGMENPWHYRNKAQIHIGIEKNSVVAGFFEYGSRRIINIEHCPVQHPLNEKMINVIRRAIRGYLDSSGDTVKTGIPVTGATIRTSFSSGKCIIAFNAAPGRTYINKYKKLAALVMAESENETKGIVLLHSGKNKQAVTLLHGEPNLEEEIPPYRYRISPFSFFQVNPLQAKILYENAASLSTKTQTAFDLYCGTGNFSLYLSKTAEEVTGVDSSGAAIEDARINTRINNIANIKFIKARAEEIPGMLLKGKKPMTVFLNPPRKGCSEKILEAVSAVKPERIVYISCNPATLARDLALLQGDGYIVHMVQPVDMFPHTSHVETVVLMSRVGKLVD